MIEENNRELFDNEGVTRSRRTIHTPSSFARKHLLYLQETGKLQSLKSHTSEREGLESFLFLVVERGSGTLTYEGREYQLKAGDAALIDCRNHYSHRAAESEQWELLWAHFDGARAEAIIPVIYKENGASPVFEFGDNVQDALLIMDELLRLKENRGLSEELRADNILGKILILCLKKTEKSRTDNLSADRVREYLNGDEAVFSGNGALKSMMKARFGKDYDEIDAAFKDKYGIDMAAYLENRKLNKAKELLRFTIRPISEIAEDLGMSDEESFCRLFSEKEEMLPDEYRKKWAQWVKG
ncbi:MAG: AraC family transcriptional regulator [Lachnospiraceae bacterium]|nr:AraC family transcriptional regulator [Lachnospiraceae bacterium]